MPRGIAWRLAVDAGRIQDGASGVGASMYHQGAVVGVKGWMGRARDNVMAEAGAILAALQQVIAAFHKA